MSPFQALNPIGKLVYLGVAAVAIPLGTISAAAFAIGMFAAMAAGLAGAFFVISQLRDIDPPGPICLGFPHVNQDLIRYAGTSACDYVAGSSNTWIPEVLRPAIFDWSPFLGFAIIAVTILLLSIVSFVVARILVVLAVGMADRALEG